MTSFRQRIKQHLRDTLRDHGNLTRAEATSLFWLLDDAEQVIAFYANPETYWGVRIGGDSPCGQFAFDCSEIERLGFVPGKRARAYMEGRNGSGQAQV